MYLDNSKSPSSRVNELDNRGSHFYLAMYWAQAIAAQDKNPALAAKFVGLAQALSENEGAIVAELSAAQGQAVDIGGYYHPDAAKVGAAMAVAVVAIVVRAVTVARATTAPRPSSPPPS